MQAVTDFLNSILAGTEALGLAQAATAFAIAYLGGVLSSLTPCVYPMIPITVSVVGAGSAEDSPSGRRSWKRVLGRSSVYVLGMAIIYSFLGVAAGLTGKVFGSFTNTSGWYLGLGTVIGIAALIMLEVIPFDPLRWWSVIRLKFASKDGNASSRPPAPKKQNSELTLLGAFSLGASSGLIAAPCTTPVLTTILAYIAKTQSVGFGLLLMTGFSLGLGTLLLTIAAFAGAVQVLPRSGNWMKTIKVVSGLILLAFAGYLVFKAGQLGGIS